jgi:hypothetical protein
MWYKVFSKLCEVIEVADLKNMTRIQFGTYKVYLNIVTDGIIECMNKDDLRSTSNRVN